MTDSIHTGSSNAPKPTEDIFKILVATDIHLGYNEKKELLGKFSASILVRNFVAISQYFNNNFYNLWNLAEDSFNTFEEILKLANSRDVDMILLGGDLFHDPTPSTNALNR